MANDLTPLEHAVVVLSRNDPVSSLKQHGALIRWILGYDGRVLRLANEKLEALRRYAILRRLKGFNLATQERRRLLDAGYGYPAIAKVDELVLDKGIARAAR